MCKLKAKYIVSLVLLSYNRNVWFQYNINKDLSESSIVQCKFCVKLIHSIHSYLRLPTGGVAYGTPKNASTGGCIWIITPLRGPYLVLTTLVLYFCTNKDASVSSMSTTTTITHIVQKDATTELNCPDTLTRTRMTSPTMTLRTLARLHCFRSLAAVQAKSSWTFPSLGDFGGGASC